MHKIGVIGPSSSIERILDVAKEFEHEIEFIPFVYNDPCEVIAIMDSNESKVNGWLFSGPLPYIIAKEVVKSDENLAYCPTTGAGFYSCCLQMAYRKNRILERVSVDMYESNDLEKLLEELQLPSSQLYIKKYNGQFNLQEMIAFHLDLWRAGKTDGAITTANSVYKALVSAGVPAYHSTLTRMEIYQALQVIIEKVKSLYFKASQVGLVIIEIDHYDEILEKAKNPYDLQYLELKIKQGLLPLCQRLNGYLMDKGNGSYEIFSSRGAVEQGINKLQDTIQYLKAELGLPAVTGIGFGETVFSAEINAHKAVRNAKVKVSSGIIVVQDNGVMIESAGEEEELIYDCYSNDAELISKLSQANIGIKTYKKIEAIIRRMEWNTFNIEQLADQMAVTPRNSRRIISTLCNVGLVECIGEKATSTRGRPGKIYRLPHK